jgi:hypothetical protein
MDVRCLTLSDRTETQTLKLYRLDMSPYLNYFTIPWLTSSLESLSHFQMGFEASDFLRPVEPELGLFKELCFP